jgi:DNA-binding NtrC family response regulator
MNNEERKTILAVDDDITVLSTIRMVLEKNHEVSLAKNTSIAKTILNKTEVDLILLDMEMPDTPGMDFLETLQNDESYYHIPVIVVSSHGVSDVITDSKEKGATDFVVKPISPGVLLSKIRSALKASRKKTTTELLVRKLKKLENACNIGKSSLVEETLRQLELFYHNKQTDAKIYEICSFARDMEYNLVSEGVKELLSDLSRYPDVSLEKPYRNQGF